MTGTIWIRYIIDDDGEAYGARPFCCRDCAIRFDPEEGELLTAAIETPVNDFPEDVQCESCGKG